MTLTSPPRTRPNLKPGEIFRLMVGVTLRAMVVIIPITIGTSILTGMGIKFFANPVAQIALVLAGYILFYNFIFGPMVKRTRELSETKDKK